MSAPEVVLQWTKLLVGYAQNGFCHEAFEIFCQIQRAGVKPNHITIASVLSACAKFALLQQGQSVHTLIVKSRIKSDVSIWNALITMYSNCGSTEDAVKVFTKMPKRDLVSWNAIIAGFAQKGNYTEALKHFSLLQHVDLKPVSITFTSVLSACCRPEALEQGKQVHTHIMKTLFELDISVGNAIVTMYSKCGSLELAHQVFDKIPQRNLVSWTAMIAGYTQSGCGYEALNLFRQLQQVGMKPNKLTFASILMACANVAALQPGMQIHGHIIKAGLDSNVRITSALLDMYAKSGSMCDVREVFGRMPEQDTVSWTAMITGCAENGFGEEALELFCDMKKANMRPDEFTLSSVLAACASVSLEHGKQVHAYLKKTGLESVVIVGNSLLTMYAKCGSIESARHVFGEMPRRNLSSWNSMIMGYAQHGQGNDALQLFEQMQETNMQPDHITFLGVLHACCHVGLVNEGRHYFYSMSRDHSITPRIDHYACMVDLLGRAGHLNEAEDFITSMPCEPGILVWQTLLGACRIHGNVELGVRAAEHLLDLDPKDVATYVLLSNIYAAAGRWDDRAKVRKTMKDRGLRKEPGCSWIEVNNRMHAFAVEDNLHL